MLIKAEQHDEAYALTLKGLDDLFYQRTRFTLWMVATFFPFFALIGNTQPAHGELSAARSRLSLMLVVRQIP